MAYDASEKFVRTRMVLGDDGLSALSRAHVAVVGLGGVGSYAAEAIARAGVGEMTLLDADVVSVSNINRQLCALESTVGKKKVDVVGARIADINPDASVHKLDFFYNEETRESLFFARFDYIIDCIDTVSAKADLICTAKEKGIPIVSALGTVPDFVGIDFFPDVNGPVFNEIEDVAGTRMLYSVYGIDAAKVYADYMTNQALGGLPGRT